MRTRVTRLTPITRLVTVTLGLIACATGMRGTPVDDWISLFDGRSLAGWRVGQNASTFRVENGEIVVRGDVAHLFYDGPVMNHEFKNFELKVDVMTRPGANSGVYLRTAFQPDNFPSKGYEVQVNNSHTDWRRTGSLYAVRDVREGVPDNAWFTIHATVRGRRIVVDVNGRQTVDYTEPDTSATRLTGGTIALQGHDPGSEVHYKNIMVRVLPP